MFAPAEVQLRWLEGISRGSGRGPQISKKPV